MEKENQFLQFRGKKKKEKGGSIRLLVGLLGLDVFRLALICFKNNQEKKERRLVFVFFLFTDFWRETIRKARNNFASLR